MKETETPKQEPEPFPPLSGALWTRGLEQWEARLDYIKRRANAYIDAFRDDIRFDFNMQNEEIEEASRLLYLAYEEFATGSYTIARVKGYAASLKDSYKRQIQPERKPEPPARNFARENWLKSFQNAKGQGKPPDPKQAVYHWNYDLQIEQRKESARLARYLSESNKRLFFAGESPIKGKICICVENGFSFDAKGKPIPEEEATRKIRAELTREIWAKSLPVSDAGLVEYKTASQIEAEKESGEAAAEIERIEIERATRQMQPESVPKLQTVDEMKKAQAEKLARRLQK